MCKSMNEFKQVEQARGLAKFFEVDIEIKIFGVTVWKYHFPPSNSSSNS